MTRQHKLAAVAASKLRKNVPHDMVSEYLERGWLIHSTHRNYVTLAWIMQGDPP